MLLQKQTSFNLDWCTQVELAPRKPGEEAGTVVWMSKGEHAALSVRGAKDGRVEIAFKRPVGDRFEVSCRPHR